MAKKTTASDGGIGIEAPNIREITFRIRGTAPYVQLRFSQKQRNKIRMEQEGGTLDKSSRKKHDPKNFDGLYEEAMYRSEDGRRGINAMSFKRAMVAACRITKMDMKRAKLCVFVVPDGEDEFEQIPLVFFTKGEPEYREDICRNANGNPDLRVRALWRAGWEANLRVRYDADVLTESGIANLLTRAGFQVGIGEGRPDSTKSDGAGMGWGTFEIVPGEN